MNWLFDRGVDQLRHVEPAGIRAGPCLHSSSNIADRRRSSGSKRGDTAIFAFELLEARLRRNYETESWIEGAASNDPSLRWNGRNLVVEVVALAWLRGDLERTRKGNTASFPSRVRNHGAGAGLIERSHSGWKVRQSFCSNRCWAEDHRNGGGEMKLFAEAKNQTLGCQPHRSWMRVGSLPALCGRRIERAFRQHPRSFFAIFQAISFSTLLISITFSQMSMSAVSHSPRLANAAATALQRESLQRCLNPA